MPLGIQDVERLKGESRFFHAGALQAVLGYPTAYYGCHFGMASTRNRAALEFSLGFYEAEMCLLRGGF